MTIKVSLEGFKGVDRALKRLTPAIQRKLLKTSLRAGGELIAMDARDRAPVLTGRLKKNIIVEDAKAPRGEAAVKVGPSKVAWYGRIVETGSVKMAPKPYLRPAFESKKRDALRVIGRELNRGIQQIARRLRGR